MKMLKKGNTGKEVKILQGLLQIHGYDVVIDGSFGTATDKAVKEVQAYAGRPTDGVVGDNTWAALGVMKPFNSKICTIQIPFTAIEAQQIMLKNNQKYSVEKFAKEYNYNFVVNAGMFDMKTLRNVQDMIIAGKIDNGGNYSDKGLAFCNNRSTGCIYASTTSKSNGKAVDFVGASPTLIIDGKRNVDMKGLTQSYFNSVTKRVCYGCDDKNFYLMITMNNCNLEAMIQEGLNQGIETLINEDGGGSQSLYLGNATVIPTDGRAIPSALGLRINPFCKKVVSTNSSSNTATKEYNSSVKVESPVKAEETKKFNKVVILDAGHNELTAGKQSPDGTYKEWEFNKDVSNRMKYHLERHGLKVIMVDSKSSSSSLELSDLVKAANASNADIYVSIHSNAYGSGWNEANGWEIYCYGTSKTSDGYKLAKSIQDATFPTIKLKNRGIKEGSHLKVIRDTTMPAVLIEHAFHTNKKEVELLKLDSFRNTVSICNVKGILNYYGMTWKDEPPKTETTKPTNSTTTTTNKKLYKVQVGAYRLKLNAQLTVNELKKLGYSPAIVKVDNFYKVQLGAFKIKSNAEKMQKQLKAKGYESILKYE